MQHKIQSEYRYELRARIALAGFRTMSAFADAINMNIAPVSHIVRGLQIPTAKQAEKIAEGLGISSQELEEIL